MSGFVIQSDKLDPATLRPVGDFLLTRTIYRTRSKGGIYILSVDHDEIKTECCIGQVVKAGKGDYIEGLGRHVGSQFEVGDFILIMQYNGHELKLMGSNYRLVRESSVWAKLIGKETDIGFDLEGVVPLYDKILAKLDFKERTSSGIFLPRQSIVGVTGTVLEFGPGKRDWELGGFIPMGVQKQDKIAVMQYSGAELMLGDEKLRLVEAPDVYSKVIDG